MSVNGRQPQELEVEEAISSGYCSATQMILPTLSFLLLAASSAVALPASPEPGEPFLPSPCPQPRCENVNIDTFAVGAFVDPKTNKCDTANFGYVGGGDLGGLQCFNGAGERQYARVTFCKTAYCTAYRGLKCDPRWMGPAVPFTTPALGVAGMFAQTQTFVSSQGLESSFSCTRLPEGLEPVAVSF